MVMPGLQKAADNKIKVLHLLHTYLPEVSGVALNTYAILKELARNAHIECVVFAPFPKKCADEGYQVPHKIIRYHRLPFKRFLFASVLLMQLLAAYRKGLCMHGRSCPEFLVRRTPAERAAVARLCGPCCGDKGRRRAGNSAA